VASAGPYANLHIAPDKQPRQQRTTLFFYRPDALPAAQPTVSKHWRYRYCLKAVNEITARQTQTSLCKHGIIKLCSIEYLTTQIELVLPTFKSWTVHKIIQYLTLGLLSSCWNIYHSTYNSLLFLTHSVCVAPVAAPHYSLVRYHWVCSSLVCHTVMAVSRINQQLTVWFVVSGKV